MVTIATADLVHWLATSGLLAAFAALIFATWWALFSDRAGDRRRCPRCWYDLTYSTGTTCGECGFTARHERELRRTRRRLLVALPAIAGSTAIGLFIVDRANLQGWMSYVPTRVVILALPFGDGARSEAALEIDRRIRGEGLTDGQWLALIERCARGDGDARPPSEAWAGKYGPLLDAAQRHAERSDDRRWRASAVAAMLAVPPRLELACREAWPADVGPTIDVAARDWWPRGTVWRVESTPRVPGAVTDVHVLPDAPIQRRSYSLTLPPLEPGAHEVRVELACARRDEARGAWVPVRREVATVPIVVSGRLEEMLEAVSGEALDRAVRRTFRRGIVHHEGGGRLPVRIGLDARETHRRLFDDTAVAVRVDVLRNGEVARQLDVWWLGGGGRGARVQRGQAWEVPWFDEEVLGRPRVPDEEWILRVSSRPELALRVEGATRYWDGEVEVRVPVIPNRGPAPPRGWVPAGQAAP